MISNIFFAVVKELNYFSLILNSFHNKKWFSVESFDIRITNQNLHFQFENILKEINFVWELELW